MASTFSSKQKLAAAKMNAASRTTLSKAGTSNPVLKYSSNGNNTSRLTQAEKMKQKMIDNYTMKSKNKTN
jgi:hypothetical protein